MECTYERLVAEDREMRKGLPTGGTSDPIREGELRWIGWTGCRRRRIQYLQPNEEISTTPVS